MKMGGRNQSMEQVLTITHDGKKFHIWLTSGGDSTEVTLENFFGGAFSDEDFKFLGGAMGYCVETSEELQFIYASLPRLRQALETQVTVN